MFGGKIGMGELILILAVLLLFFGGKKIPDLARSLGRSIGEFKKGREEGRVDEHKDNNSNSPDKPA